MLKRFAVLAFAVLATACSATPEAGDDCSPEGAIACESTSQALFCQGGKLVAVPCRGAAGCITNNERGTCDLTRALAGDACPSAVANQGQCDANNANRLLRCTSGTWTAEVCNGCAVQGSSIYCQP